MVLSGYGGVLSVGETPTLQASPTPRLVSDASACTPIPIPLILIFLIFLSLYHSFLFFPGPSISHRQMSSDKKLLR